MSSSASGRLLGLEAGRFVAALLVAAFHFSLAFYNLRGDPIFGMAFRAGHAGVEYFFVLSGFIIYHVHKRDLGRPSELKPFVLKRFIRLYPLYWLTFFGMLAVFVAVPSLRGDRILTPGNLVLDGLLLPKPGDSVVLQSWSLRHEIVFYAVFAIAVVNFRIGMIVLCLWQALCLVIGSMYPDSLPLVIKPFFYIYNLGFGIGILAAWATDRFTVRHPGVIGAVGAIGFVAAMYVEWLIGGTRYEGVLPLGSLLSPAIYMSCATLIVFGFTQYEKTHDLPFAATLKILGGCSYCLYLIHAPLGSLLIRAFNVGPMKLLPNAVVFVLMILITIMVSVLAHLLFERPVLGRLRDRLLPKRIAAESGSPAVAASR